MLSEKTVFFVYSRNVHEGETFAVKIIRLDIERNIDTTDFYDLSPQKLFFNKTLFSDGMLMVQLSPGDENEDVFSVLKVIIPESLDEACDFELFSSPLCGDKNYWEFEFLALKSVPSFTIDNERKMVWDFVDGKWKEEKRDHRVDKLFSPHQQFLESEYVNPEEGVIHCSVIENNSKIAIRKPNPDHYLPDLKVKRKKDPHVPSLVALFSMFLKNDLATLSGDVLTTDPFKHRFLLIWCTCLTFALTPMLLFVEHQYVILVLILIASVFTWYGNKERVFTVVLLSNLRFGKSLILSSLFHASKQESFLHGCIPSALLTTLSPLFIFAL